jgi:hypothetical protein
MRLIKKTLTWEKVESQKNLIVKKLIIFEFFVISTILNKWILCCLINLQLKNQLSACNNPILIFHNLVGIFEYLELCSFSMFGGGQ